MKANLKDMLDIRPALVECIIDTYADSDREPWWKDVEIQYTSGLYWITGKIDTPMPALAFIPECISHFNWSDDDFFRTTIPFFVDDMKRLISNDVAVKDRLTGIMEMPTEIYVLDEDLVLLVSTSNEEERQTLARLGFAYYGKNLWTLKL